MNEDSCLSYAYDTLQHSLNYSLMTQLRTTIIVSAIMTETLMSAESQAQSQRNSWSMHVSRQMLNQLFCSKFSMLRKSFLNFCLSNHYSKDLKFPHWAFLVISWRVYIVTGWKNEIFKICHHQMIVPLQFKPLFFFSVTPEKGRADMFNRNC